MKVKESIVYASLLLWSLSSKINNSLETNLCREWWVEKAPIPRCVCGCWTGADSSSSSSTSGDTTEVGETDSHDVLNETPSLWYHEKDSPKHVRWTFRAKKSRGCCVAVDTETISEENTRRVAQAAPDALWVSGLPGWGWQPGSSSFQSASVDAAPAPSGQNPTRGCPGKQGADTHTETWTHTHESLPDQERWRRYCAVFRSQPVKQRRRSPEERNQLTTNARSTSAGSCHRNRWL